jgi:capsular polysaccharide biosynthesis protein
MKKLWSVVLVLGTALVVTAVAVAVFHFKPESHTAKGVLVVPPAGLASVGSNPTGSVQLATTYAAVLQTDAQLYGRAAKQLRVRPATLQRAVAVAAVPGSSAIDVVVRSSTPVQSERFASAIKAALAQPIEGDQAEVSTQQLQAVSGAVTAAPAAGGGFESRLRYVIAAGGSPNPDAANRLAADYAGLISEDDASLAPAAQSIGVSVNDLRGDLTITNDVNTSLVRLSLSRPTYASARTALVTLMNGLTAARPVSAAIAPSSLSVVHLPDADPPKSRWALATVIGLSAVVGLGLGLILASVRRRRAVAA